ncbi:hypothetical protein AEH57_04785 [Lactococcus garvieae]|nr:hypothetical protein AEH57_04785 [Lactococcus garvieae]
MLFKTPFLSQIHKKTRKTENFRLLFCYNENKHIVDVLKSQMLKIKRILRSFLKRNFFIKKKMKYHDFIFLLSTTFGNFLYEAG